MLALLGDSHTRSYKVSQVVATRIFLAQGRKNNFNNVPNFFLTTFRYLKAARKLKKSGLDLVFIIGEPDVRRLAYGKWDIARDEEEVLASEQQLIIDDKTLNKLVIRVKYFLIITRYFKYAPSLVIGSGTPNPEIALASSFFNERLSRVCKKFGCLFFNPQEYTLSKEGRVKKKFIGYSVFNPIQKDHTHLSTEISEYFDLFVSEYLQFKKTDNDDWKEKSDFTKYFVEVQNFDTYTLNEFWLKRWVKLIRGYVQSIKLKL
ncbi:MAG: hypothetical protein GQ548_02230 [Methylophaga sp.]|nr:hypothetical protein [Methylophaga sp.]